jgi:tetratricopeptide (TPR) repeat protein
MTLTEIKRAKTRGMSGGALGLLCLLALMGCATTDEWRFPLQHVSADARSQLGWAREALPVYQRMGADFEREGRFADATVAYSNSAKIALVLRRLQDAFNASLKAVETAERTGRPSHLAAALHDLGTVYVLLNAPGKAIPLFQRAARYRRTSWDARGEGASHRELARAYRKVGERELALETAQKAVEILRVAQIREVAEPQPRSRSLERNYARALVELGQTYLALRQLDPARVAFEEALSAAEWGRVPHVSAQAHRGLGRVAAAQGASQAAVSHLQEALRLSQRPGFIAATQGRLGRIHRRMGKLPEAEGALRQAVAGIEDMRSLIDAEELRDSFLEDKMDAYRNLVHVLFDQRKLTEAFDFSERARARAFLDLLGHRVALGRGRSTALIAEERTLQERISALKAQPKGSPVLRRELELAREAYQAFLQRVRRLDREQAPLMYMEPLTLAGVQSLLEPETVLLEYFVGGGRTLLWVVGRDSMRALRLRIGREELARRVSEFRELIASRGRTEDLQRTAQELYRILVAPAFPAGLPREVLIVPHDVLDHLPFHALMSAPGRYLFQEASLHSYSSGSLIQFTQAKVVGRGCAALRSGDPDLDASPTLGCAKREDGTPSGLLSAAQDEATKAHVYTESGQHTILQFSTHAELDETNPAGSVLFSGTSRGHDEDVEVKEILSLDPNTSPLVLPACETAFGGPRRRVNRSD